MRFQVQYCIALVLSLGASAPLCAQVHGPGPSDPSLFANVFNVPSDPVGSSVGGQLGETTQVNLMNGGSLDFRFRAHSGSEVNISGGSVGDRFGANWGSEVNISGGSVGDGFDANSGSTVTISGGTVGVVGGLRSVFGGEVNISGGSVDNFDAWSGEVNISGGSVGDEFNALSGSEIYISGGSVGDNFRVTFSKVTISGGSVGESFGAAFGSEVNISGGSVGDNFGAAPASKVSISGGSVGDGFRADSGSDVNIFGSEFFLDGLAIEELVLGEAFTISDRDVTLTGLLADGNPFDFELNDESVVGFDFFSPAALLTVTLVEAAVCNPNTGGDFDGNGIVEFVDFLVLSANFGAEVDGHELGDIDCTGSVEFADFLILSANFGNTVEGTESVPEPNGLAIVAAAGLACLTLRRRRS